MRPYLVTYRLATLTGDERRDVQTSAPNATQAVEQADDRLRAEFPDTWGRWTLWSVT